MTSVQMPVLRGPGAGLSPGLVSHVSGGRDLWTEPLDAEPSDPGAWLWEAINEVLDPEIPIGLVDLGLVYGVAFSEGAVDVDLTFTATACPCMAFIREDITDRLEQESWVQTVRIHEVWNPPWTRDRISPRGRRLLKSLGVGS